MTDRIERLRQAAQARHAATRARAEAALEILARRHEPITFRRLAETAGVSRSWLYRQPDLRTAIEHLRSAKPPEQPPPPQQATLESLRQQRHAYREEIARLKNENQILRDQLARKLGAERAASVTRRNDDSKGQMSPTRNLALTSGDPRSAPENLYSYGLGGEDPSAPA